VWWVRRRGEVMGGDGDVRVCEWEGGGVKKC